MSLNGKSIYLILLSLLMIVFTIVFKLGTGGLYTTNDETLKEVMKYEIQKRKQDISIRTLKESVLNFDTVFASLTNELNQSTDSCVQTFYTNIIRLPEDSAYYKIIEEMYRYASYYEAKQTENGRVVFLFQDKNTACSEPTILHFITINESEQLITRIDNFANYLTCYCDETFNLIE